MFISLTVLQIHTLDRVNRVTHLFGSMRFRAHQSSTVTSVIALLTKEDLISSNSSKFVAGLGTSSEHTFTITVV